jgi:hypothetical protein
MLSQFKPRNISSQNSFRRHKQLAPLDKIPINKGSHYKVPLRQETSDREDEYFHEESSRRSYRKVENPNVGVSKRVPKSQQNLVRPPAYPMPKPLQEALLKVDKMQYFRLIYSTEVKTLECTTLLLFLK